MSMKGFKNKVGEKCFREAWLLKGRYYIIKEQKRSITGDQHFGGEPYVFPFLINIHKNDPELEY